MSGEDGHHDRLDRRPENSALGNWFLLMDPAWSPRHENEAPPLEAVVGVWPLADDGRVGKFRPNPDHVPADSGAPSDPLDAVFRLAGQGRAETEQVRLMLRASFFDIAVNADGRSLLTLSPDDVPCVVVATGEALAGGSGHRDGGASTSTTSWPCSRTAVGVGEWRGRNSPGPREIH